MPRKPSVAKAATVTAEQLSTMTISQIAAIVRKDWTRPYFGSVPYIDAMCSLESIDDAYGYDPGRQIVAYFLANANTYRGANARLVKAELNKRLKSRSERRSA